MGREIEETGKVNASEMLINEVKANNGATVKAILAKPEGLQALNVADSNGYLPIHHAAAGNHQNSLNAILDKKEGLATINIRNNAEFTPIMSAFYAGRNEAVAKLSAYDAEPISQSDINIMAANAYNRIEQSKDKTDEKSKNNFANNNHVLGLVKAYAADNGFTVPADKAEAEIEIEKDKWEAAKLAQQEEKQLEAEEKKDEAPKVALRADKPETVKMRGWTDEEKAIANAGKKPEEKKELALAKEPAEKKAVTPKEELKKAVRKADHDKPKEVKAPDTFGIGAKGTLTAEFKAGHEKKGGFKLSKGNELTANDAAILVSNGIKPILEEGGKYRFPKAEMRAEAVHKSKPSSSKSAHHGDDDSHPCVKVGRTLAHPLRALGNLFGGNDHDAALHPRDLPEGKAVRAVHK